MRRIASGSMCNTLAAAAATREICVRRRMKICREHFRLTHRKGNTATTCAPTSQAKRNDVLGHQGGLCAGELEEEGAFACQQYLWIMGCRLVLKLALMTGHIEVWHFAKWGPMEHDVLIFTRVRPSTHNPGLHLDDRHTGGSVRVSLQQLERLRSNVGPDRVAEQDDGQLLGQHKVSDEGHMVVNLVCQAEHLPCTTAAGNVLAGHHLSWLQGIGAPCLS